MNQYRRRKVGTRRQRRILALVCEGTTESKYFNNYRTPECDLRIHIPDTSMTDPVGLVQFALRLATDLDMDFEYGDRLWCVFDVDDNSRESIEESKRKALPNVRLALSNPCFELWFLLHFVNYTTRLTRCDATSKLKRYLPKYLKSGDNFVQLRPSTRVAISRSKNLNKMHTRYGVELLSIDSCPSTQVFEVVEYILEHSTIDCG
jgi:hypothetical protein